MIPLTPAPADGPLTVLIGPPGPLRFRIAGQLHDHAALLRCLDRPAGLAPDLSVRSGLDGAALDGATVVLLTVPQVPRLAGRLRRRPRAQALAAEFSRAATDARRGGAARMIALSTVFRYDDDHDEFLVPGSPLREAAETAAAAAAEEAAHQFSGLGGDSVILRLGWCFGAGDDITDRVLSAARRGWRLIDGDPAAWLALLAPSDAARAVTAALTAAPGTYNVTDGRPVIQAALSDGLGDWAGTELHPLDDPQWGGHGVLFGPSRRIRDTGFTDLTGWRPRVSGAAGHLAALGAGG
jgi:nucleoside-diphosphate-sugar epimerase